MVLGKKDDDAYEEIIRIKNLDKATCESLKGVLDEDGRCLVRYHKNPKDPDTLVIKAIKYKPSNYTPREE